MLDLPANKWAALAIGAMEERPQRFGALQRRLEGVSPKVLTSTLRRLEEKGFVDRTICPAGDRLKNRARRSGAPRAAASRQPAVAAPSSAAHRGAAGEPAGHVAVHVREAITP
ncbi:winged helix-turn-helix transcriptional regulator [Streptomyces sparsogenes]|uniref:winged helix-turn-helix transcriptional regulator n=1 Tax=Streptomyces sparsogenes TaxID=67365 RepID=UPI0033F3C26F